MRSPHTYITINKVKVPITELQKMLVSILLPRGNQWTSGSELRRLIQATQPAWGKNIALPLYHLQKTLARDDQLAKVVSIEKHGDVRQMSYRLVIITGTSVNIPNPPTIKHADTAIERELPKKRRK